MVPKTPSASSTTKKPTKQPASTRSPCDSAVTATHKAPGDYPGSKAGDILTVELTVIGIPCLGINGGPQFPHSEALSFQIATDTQEETDRWSISPTSIGH